MRARTNVTKGPGSREAGIAMCFKLIEAAEGRWRRVNAPELVALVRAGAKFVNGRLEAVRSGRRRVTVTRDPTIRPGGVTWLS